MPASRSTLPFLLAALLTSAGPGGWGTAAAAPAPSLRQAAARALTEVRTRSTEELGRCGRRLGPALDPYATELRALAENSAPVDYAALHTMVEPLAAFAQDHCTVRTQTLLATAAHALERLRTAQRPVAPSCAPGADCGAVAVGAPLLDAMAFRALLTRLRLIRNRFSRQDMVTRALRGHSLTTMQLAAILDAFESGLIRVDVVKALAPSIVDPEYAQNLRTKFDNALLGQAAVRAVQEETAAHQRRGQKRPVAREG